MNDPKSPQSVEHAADPADEGRRARGPGPAGDTHAVVDGDSSPRLPHERDESADDAGNAPRPIVEQGRKDVAAGKSETDRGEATDELYARTLRGG